MDTYHDRKADRLFITEPARPIVAAVVFALAALFVALCLAMPWIEAERGWFWLFEAVCIIFAAILLRFAVQTCTELVAICDGPARTLTVVRTRPWRRTEETIGYADVVAVATRKRIVPDAVDQFIWFTSRYDLEITLADDRKIAFPADNEDESDDAVVLVGGWLAAARRRGEAAVPG